MMVSLVTVTVCNNGITTVSITGDEQTKNAARVEMLENTLSISAPIPTVPNQHVSGAIVNLGGVQVFEGNLTISTMGTSGGGIQGISPHQQDTNRKIAVTVSVPAGTAIVIADELVGNILIGDTLGNVTVTTHGINSVTTGKISDLTCIMSGNSVITVADASGSIRIDASGTTKATVNGGTAQSITVIASGFAKICHFATVKTANLVASGASQIELDTCEGYLKQHRSGAAQITVKHQQVP